MNCPHCKAKIEENARFCIFCMTSLDEKEAIAPFKRQIKRWWPMAVAALLVVLGLGVWWLWPSKKPTKSAAPGEVVAGQTEQQEELTPPVETPSEESPSVETPNAESPSVETPNAESPPDETPKAENPTVETPKAENPTVETPKAENPPVETPTDETPTDRPPTKQPEQKPVETPQEPSVEKPVEQENPKEEQTPPPAEEAEPSKPQEQPPAEEPQTPEPEEQKPVVAEAEYYYRDAKYGDDYHVNAYIDDAVVITGIKTPAADGIYRLPSELGGKRVIAVMGLTFFNSGHHLSVKKVVVPASIRTIWDNAFKGCANLTDIYFCGESIFVSSWAFPEPEERNGTLTIHCSETCNNRDLRYYKNIADYYYDAVFKEWDGGVL